MCVLNEFSKIVQIWMASFVGNKARIVISVSILVHSKLRYKRGERRQSVVDLQHNEDKII